MSPVIMQMVTGVVFIFCIPFFVRLSGGMANIKWSAASIALTTCATLLSIGANILLYTSLKGSQNTGSTAMLISLYPVVTLILSAVFLNEQFSTLKIFGVIAMIGGAIMLSWK